MTIPALNNLSGALEETSKSMQALKRDGEYRIAAAKVEEMFVEMLMRQINKGISRDTLGHGGAGEEMFHSQLNAIYAERTAESGGIGIAKTVYEQMSRGNADLNGLSGTGGFRRFGGAMTQGSFSAIG